MELRDALALRDYWNRRPPVHEWIYKFFGNRLQSPATTTDSEADRIASPDVRAFKDLPPSVREAIAGGK